MCNQITHKLKQKSLIIKAQKYEEMYNTRNCKKYGTIKYRDNN